MILSYAGHYLSCVARKPGFGFPTKSNTNLAVRKHKMAKGLNLPIKTEDGLYYMCSENKGADQLRGCHTADLPLCFRKYIEEVYS